MRQRVHQPFGVLPLGALALAIGAVLALVLAGCGSDGGDGEPVASGSGAPSSTVPPDDPDDRPSGTLPTTLPADQVVFQAQTGGGFVPMQAAATEIPEVTVYGDGRVFVIDAREDRPYDVGPGLRTTTLSPEALRSFIERATDTALFDGPTDLGQPMVTDLPTTTVTLQLDRGPVTLEAYALGLDIGSTEDAGGGAPSTGLTEEQVARRAALDGLVEDALALGADGAPWMPDRLRATAYDPAQVQREGTTEVAPWPGRPIAEIPAPAPEGAVASCLVLEGEEADAVWRATAGRTSSWWSDPADPTVERQIVVVPLVPGAEGCPSS